MFVSAEIRWFYPDECPTNLHRWFGEMSPAPGGGKLRIDEYLSQTNQSEVSIKKRGGKPGVEIKGTLKDSLMARLDRLGEAREVAEISTPSSPYATALPSSSKRSQSRKPPTSSSLAPSATESCGSGLWAG